MTLLHLRKRGRVRISSYFGNLQELCLRHCHSRNRGVFALPRAFRRLSFHLPRQPPSWRVGVKKKVHVLGLRHFPFFSGNSHCLVLRPCFPSLSQRTMTIGLAEPGCSSSNRLAISLSGTHFLSAQTKTKRLESRKRAYLLENGG